jgi:hypothetical protein
MDRVLIDAPAPEPAPGAGGPDAKWRISEKNITDRVADQDKVLEDAAQLCPARAVNWPMSPAPAAGRKHRPGQGIPAAPSGI